MNSLYIFFIQHQNTTNDANDDDNNFIEIIMLYVQTFNSFVCVFGICEFGERVSLAFIKINIQLDRIKWYLLPGEAQKMLPTILIVAQQPVELDMFGSISCNRITFKEVNLLYTYKSILLSAMTKYLLFSFRFAIKRIRRL